jgi:hypothetical protein
LEKMLSVAPDAEVAALMALARQGQFRELLAALKPTGDLSRLAAAMRAAKNGSVDKLRALLCKLSSQAKRPNGNQLPPRVQPHFSGTGKPWTKGATPDSIYTHIDPKTGKAVQNAIYDSNGNVIGHVDFSNHGPGAPSGHGHTFPQPGNPASGHGPGKPHSPNGQLPPGWVVLPPGVQPRTPIGR